MSEAIESSLRLSIAFSYSFPLANNPGPSDCKGLPGRNRKNGKLMNAFHSAPLRRSEMHWRSEMQWRSAAQQAHRCRSGESWLTTPQPMVGRRFSSGTILVAILMLAVITPKSSLLAQGSLPKVNYLLDSRQPPGVVAGAQAMRHQSSVGSFQAVSISGPTGLQVALAKDGQFLPTLDAPVTTAMMVGAVYRFRVTHIPFRPGQELYPTLEVIDRLYTPPGREHRFPIPVVLTEEDLRAALDGALVTRVIYLEDSEAAEPLASLKGQQRTTDVTPTDNALQVADALGRPVAILRIGSRTPSSLTGDLTHFLYGCPPWIPLPAVPDKQQLIQQGQWPEAIAIEPTDQPYPETPLQNYPRTDVPY